MTPTIVKSEGDDFTDNSNKGDIDCEKDYNSGVVTDSSEGDDVGTVNYFDLLPDEVVMRILSFTNMFCSASRVAPVCRR